MAGLLPLLSAQGLATANDFTLKISGNVEQELVLSLDDLKALGMTKVRTTSTWNAEAAEFEGPLVRDVLAKAVAKGKTVTAIASNNFQVPIPVSEFSGFDVIIAIRENGEPISRRRKGPARIVYPRDNHPDEIDINRDSYWVWNLIELQVAE
ncbi:molybdopterin-dependent oxidoreductase [Coralliovum pocilloporae]|uniref:molybdopterin-dependent oxidoreductase n=1 Tax=Coralliovum pocilloporae TaxID=3066369 RepID=UPI003306ABC0